MKEIAVSFRVSFEADDLSGTNLYKMEQYLLTWLREVTDNEEYLRALCRNLEHLAEQPIEQFYMMAIDDLTSARKESLMDRMPSRRIA